jgi:mannosyltransferase
MFHPDPFRKAIVPVSVLSQDRGRMRRSPFVTSILVLGITAAGLLLRLHLLTQRNLWDDEGASVFFSHLPWRAFLKTMWNYEANMSLYYLLLRGWLHFGDSEAVVRGLSVLFGIAAIPATYALGKQLFGEREGMVSSVLSAINMFQIRYSQEARAYSLVMFLSIVSTYCFLRAIDMPRQRRYWFGYVIASALGVYGHVFFYLVVAAQWLSLGFVRLRIRSRALLWTAVGFLLLTAPMNVFLLTKNQGQLSWIPQPSFQLLFDFANLFTGYGGSALLALMEAFCLIAILVAYRGTQEQADERWRVNLVVWWLVFPILLTVVISFLRPVFFDRFMTICAPALSLLAGKGLVDLERVFPRLRVLFPVSLVLVIGLSSRGIHRYANTPASLGDPWQLVTQYVLANERGGDAAIFYRLSGSRPFTYYSRRAIERHNATSSPVIIFPEDMSNAKRFNVEPSESEVRRTLDDHQRVWLVLQHYAGLSQHQAAKQAIQDALEERYHVVQEKTFTGWSGTIQVLLYELVPYSAKNR